MPAATYYSFTIRDL